MLIFFFVLYYSSSLGFFALFSSCASFILLLFVLRYLLLSFFLLEFFCSVFFSWFSLDKMDYTFAAAFRVFTFYCCVLKIYIELFLLALLQLHGFQLFFLISALLFRDNGKNDKKNLKFSSPLRIFRCLNHTKKWNQKFCVSI